MWLGPERVQIHLWKMAQGATVTNLFRQKRGIDLQGVCPMCNLEEESILHLTWDCRGVLEVWLRLTENRLPPEFFNDDIHA